MSLIPLPSEHKFKQTEKVGLSSVLSLYVPVSKITHSYVPAPHIAKAMPLIGEIIRDSKAWFEKQAGEKFNSYNSEHASIMRPRIQQDGRTPLALEVLNLPVEHADKLYIAWWSEEACEDKGVSFTPNGGLHLSLGARHSWRTQMARMGVDDPRVSPVYSSSVVGLVHTSDDKIVVNLRGGQNMPMTYYYAAGALKASDDVKSGSPAAVWNAFVQHELMREYNIGQGHVADAHLISRVVCHGTGDLDTSYVFAVRTNLSASQFDRQYRHNTDDDRQEHKDVLYLSPHEVVPFVREFYKGLVQNDLSRPYEKRVLLPQAAAPLLSYVRADVALLDELAGKYGQPV